jgi:hypothetical protein
MPFFVTPMSKDASKHKQSLSKTFLVLGIIAILSCSCKKSDESEISTLPQKIIDVAKTGITNWAATNGIDLQKNPQWVTGAEVVGRSVGMVITNEIFLETGHAGEFLKKMHDDGNLPGVSKDDHGNFSSDEFTYLYSNNVNGIVFSNAGTITYPLSRTFHLVKNGETSTNNFALVKNSKDSDWKLQRAWETDSNGQTIQEWPVP